jgi:subtilisin family serine protease
VESYGYQGSGARQPVAVALQPPARKPDIEFTDTRRPVVAILDTGCGHHPWLVGVVDETVTLDGATIGYVDDATDPEMWPDQSGPLDGSIDHYAGHGTFIAGLIHQACPDADIVSWRIMSSAGPIVESDLVDTLADIAEVARRHRDGDDGGEAIDVLSLSMGYYHETPEDVLFDSTMYDILKVLGQCGVAVICSAGNDATARPMFPAAFAPWADGNGPIATEAGVVPVVSVGALNPNGTDAMFSNAGPWVRAYAAGASIVSTTPPFQGGLEPLARTEVYRRRRETIDPDDYSSTFAVWSGTSFSAPLFAGRLAAQLAVIPEGDAFDTRAEAVARGWAAVEALTDIAP